MENKVLSASEYSEIIAKIQFLQNKTERLERENNEKKDVLTTIKHNFEVNLKYNTECTSKEMTAGLNLIKGVID